MPLYSRIVHSRTCNRILKATPPAKRVEPAHQTLEIADTIAIGVLVLLDVEAVGDCVLVPEIGDRDSCAAYVQAAGPSRRTLVQSYGCCTISWTMRCAIGRLVPHLGSSMRHLAMVFSHPHVQGSVFSFCRAAVRRSGE